tara:strand:+ start:238 stop:1323 length:1086 start_codon:yes stop_codon:yes gene_type:complete
MEIFTRQLSIFNSDSDRRKRVTDFRDWSKRTQDRMFDLLKKLDLWMRQNVKWNTKHPNNTDNVPSLLPLNACVHILTKLGVSTHLQLNYGRRILVTFRAWKIEERARQEMARGDTPATPIVELEQEQEAASSETIPTTDTGGDQAVQRKALQKKRKEAVALALGSMRSTSSAAAKKAKATTTSRSIRHSSYDAATDKYVCVSCKRAFVNQNSLNGHTCPSTNEVGFYVCPKCDTYSQGSETAAAHAEECERSRSRKKGIACDFCRKSNVLDFKLGKNETMSQHCDSFSKESSHPSSNDTLCTNCNKYYDHHKRHDHHKQHKCKKKIVEGKWICIYCQLNSQRNHIFDTNKKFQNHNTMYHS